MERKPMKDHMMAVFFKKSRENGLKIPEDIREQFTVLNKKAVLKCLCARCSETIKK
jgi:hypothetical protein